jgi:uncharacterized protein (DUF362 family)
MQNVWINNVPCNKNLIELSCFYENYIELKSYLFDIMKKTEVFNDVGIDKKILLKPNWVYNNVKESDKLCLTTHPNIILAVLEFILQLRPSSVIIGDSPIQSCNWDLLHSSGFIKKIIELQEINKISIKIVDFRNEKWEQKRTLQKNCRNKSDYILYDLFTDSLLEPLSVLNKTFRVGDYALEETIKNHNKGTHKYLIAREVIDADIIVNLPKLKTHQKAGITNGLKNYVGTIGDKACLAHYSSNLSQNGGDCFPGNNLIRKSAEYFKEISYKFKGKFFYYPLHYLSSAIWGLAPKSNYANLSGAWYGNDTVWRMVLDINKIMSFGTLNGEISSVPQRKLVTISDAIIAGQCDGPLNPKPHPMGMVSISKNDFLLDYIMANLMGFEGSKIPLLRSCVNTIDKSEVQVYLDGRRINLCDLNKYSIKALPPKGWVGKMEHT